MATTGRSARRAGAGLRVVAAAMVVAFCCLGFLPGDGPAVAAVSGPCSNCHTMHNSQGGQPMAYALSGSSYAATETPNAALLVTDCLGCHSSTDGSTWKDAVTGAPVVYNTAEPSYGSTSDGGTTHNGLAGGNFYWLSQGDAKGHNIMGADGTLSQAPGDVSGCGNDSCHDSLSTAYGGTGDLAGRSGCLACHMVSGNTSLSMTGFHHRDDSATVVNQADQGWYRFLSGHYDGDGYGVSGIEDADWEHAPTASAHNEYLGSASDKTDSRGFSGQGATMTAFCSGCHGTVHVQDDTMAGASPWLRHPSDAVLPATGEYAACTAFDPMTPVARPSLTSVGSGVTPGSDMVMCLSCHRAHASPYDKLMRWDYASTSLGTALAGCGVCHTRKY